MRLRSTVPAVAATALLAATLAVPAQAMADTSPSPSPSPSAPATGPTQVTTPTPGLPFAQSLAQYSNTGVQIGVWDVDAAGTWSAKGITGVSLHFRLHGDAADAPDDAVIGGLVQASPTVPVWSAPSPVKLPQLGVYDVSAEVTDQAGNDVIVPNVGQFTYAATVALSNLHATPSTLDFDHRTVTVTGQATITDPRTGGPIAPDHLEVGLSYTGTVANGMEATVNPDGTFTASGTVTSGPTLTFTPSGAWGFGATPYRFTATSATSNSVSIVQEPTRIRLLEPANVYVKTAPAMLKGVVEREVGTTWVPAPGLPVAGGSTSAITAADGSFSLAITWGGVYTVTTAGDPAATGSWQSGVYLTGSTSAWVHVHIPAPTYFSSESYSEDATGEAMFTLDLSTGSTAPIPDNTESVAVQYSPDNRTWHFLGWTRIGRPGVGSDTVQFYANAGANANGYWRAYYPGDADRAAAVSSVMHLYRVPTTITGGHPSTTHAYYGQTVRFGGTLWQQHGGWVRMNNCKVALVFRPAGSKTWYYVTGGRTNAAGNFSLGARDTRSGTWAVVYIAPDQAHLDAVGPMTYVSA
ncbi:hypothetical protein ABH931_007603 [Streptacidiphilus sp. MAP12-33]|uniref:hypothetical protein n=1 Tax=Streptacidiphilus sp. MAP12-33 TaxID=3156266 RepID=UPI0035121AF2